MTVDLEAEASKLRGELHCAKVEVSNLQRELELAQAVNRLSKIGHEAGLATAAVVGDHFADLLMDAGYLPRRPDWKHDDPAQAAAWLRGMLKLGANDRAPTP